MAFWKDSKEISSNFWWPENRHSPSHWCWPCVTAGRRLSDHIPHQAQASECSAGFAEPPNSLRNSFIVNRDLPTWIFWIQNHSQEEGVTASTLPLLIMNENTTFSVLLMMNTEWKGQIRKLMAGQRFSLARVKIKSCGVRKEKGPECPQNFHMTFRYQ